MANRRLKLLMVAFGLGAAVTVGVIGWNLIESKQAEHAALTASVAASAQGFPQSYDEFEDPTTPDELRRAEVILSAGAAWGLNRSRMEYDWLSAVTLGVARPGWHSDSDWSEIESKFALNERLLDGAVSALREGAALRFSPNEKLRSPHLACLKALGNALRARVALLLRSLEFGHSERGKNRVAGRPGRKIS